MPKLCQLAIQILIHSVEPFLQFLLGEFADWVMSGIVIHVREKDCL